ncbi:hypothetical protein FRC11_004323, partial [Ceratobasidium sp. 423]
AALFSAISTAFLIQTSGMLTQNPNDVSAAALLAISQTLFAIANNSSANLTMPEPNTTSDFVPSQNAVIVNTLWYLSLSLSIATAFLAVLAKDWCYWFSANRTGHPRDQALRRQRKWTMIERWKMQGLILALPSLIHLSLWLAVNIPLYAGLLTALLLSFVFGLPLLALDKLGPKWFAKSWRDVWTIPSSPVRFLLNSLLNLADPFGMFVVLRLQELKPDELTDELTTSLALSWLIQHCETPSAVDTALQSIAGASRKIPVEPLQSSQAAVQIQKRMFSNETDDEERPSTELYKRGLQFLGLSSESQSCSDSEPNGMKGDVEVLVWYLKSENERESPPRGTGFLPSRQNLHAMKIWNTAVPQFLRLLKKQEEGCIQALYKTIAPLSDHLSGKEILHPAAVQSLANAAALYASCLVAPNRELDLRLIQISLGSCRLSNSNSDRFNPLQPISVSSAEAVLAICALLVGRPGGVSLAGMGESEFQKLTYTRAKYTIDTLLDIYSSGKHHWSLITRISYLEILSNPGRYGLNALSINSNFGDLMQECGAYFHQYAEHATLYSFPCGLGYLVPIGASLFKSGLLKAIGDVYGILAISYTCGSTTALQPPLAVYALVAYFTCMIGSSSQEDLELCKKLMSSFGFLRLSDKLIDMFTSDSNDKGEPFVSSSWALRFITLLGSTYRDKKAGPIAQHFSATQLWLLLELVGNSSTDDQKRLERSIEEMARGKLQIQNEGVDGVKKELEGYIVESYGRGEHLGVYSSRVVECILEARGGQTYEGLNDRVQADLKGVPTCIRGLSSFASDPAVLVPLPPSGRTSLESEAVSQMASEIRNDIDHVGSNDQPSLQITNQSCENVINAIPAYQNDMEPAEAPRDDVDHVSINVRPAHLPVIESQL